MSDPAPRPSIAFPVDERWLATHAEEALDPGRPIVDPHHHLWDRQQRYLFDELLKDLRSGHDIRATVYLQCGSMYRADGDPNYASVGETEFVNGVAAMSASGGYGALRRVRRHRRGPCRFAAARRRRRARVGGASARRRRAAQGHPQFVGVGRRSIHRHDAHPAAARGCWATHASATGSRGSRPWACRSMPGSIIPRSPS